MNIRLVHLLILTSFAWIAPPTVGAQDDGDAGPQPAWVSLSASERREVLAFAEDYKDFMSRAKTEVSFVKEAVKVAREAGFRELTDGSDLRPGGRFYDINRDRTITFIRSTNARTICLASGIRT